MRKRPLRRGFTLRELLAVVTIICVLLALLVPLIQASRGRARRTQCENNLKNIGLGLQNYHDTYKMFPMGAMHSGPNPGGDPPVNAALGPSWWFGIAPFMEQRNVYDCVQSTQSTWRASQTRVLCQMTMTCRPEWRSTALQPDFMRCPPSPLPRMESPTGPICLPTYVGIAGGCDIDPNSQDYQPGLVVTQNEPSLPQRGERHWGRGRRHRHVQRHAASVRACAYGRLPGRHIEHHDRGRAVRLAAGPEPSQIPEVPRRSPAGPWAARGRVAVGCPAQRGLIQCRK